MADFKARWRSWLTEWLPLLILPQSIEAVARVGAPTICGGPLFARAFISR